MMIQVCRGHFDFAQLLRLQVTRLVWSLQQSLYTALHIIDFYYNFAELFYFFSSGVGFGCSSGNNAGKKGSIKFAEKVMPVFFLLKLFATNTYSGGLRQSWKGGREIR